MVPMTATIGGLLRGYRNPQGRPEGARRGQKRTATYQNPWKNKGSSCPGTLKSPLLYRLSHNLKSVAVSYQAGRNSERVPHDSSGALNRPTVPLFLRRDCGGQFADQPLGVDRTWEPAVDTRRLRIAECK